MEETTLLSVYTPWIMGVGLFALLGYFFVNKKQFDSQKLLDLFLTKYRWIPVCFLVLPASLVFEFLMDLRNRYVIWTHSAPAKHVERVQKIQQRVRQWHERYHNKQSNSKEINGPNDGLVGDGQDYSTNKSVPKMCTGRPSWQTMSARYSKYKKTNYTVNIPLYDILKIDTERQIVTCEPLVTCGQLTRTLVPRGWTLPVLPELDDLTVGGLISGFGVETSSHKYGLFQYICEAYEIVLADGSLVRASKDENSELYYAFPWSHGTLGFLVSVDIRIIPAYPYVELNYHPFTSKEAAIKFFEEKSRSKDHEFVEMLAYSETDSVVMLGQMVDNPAPSKINHISYFWKPWFYEYVRGFLKEGKPQKEYIPLRDYYHRHTKSLFWEMQDILPFGNHVVFRYLFGWLIPPKVSFLKLTRTKGLTELYEKHHVIQDMIIPVKSLSEALSVFHDEVLVYPLWICPARLVPTPQRGFVNPTPTDDLFVDVGAYGVPKAAGFEAAKAHRNLEAYVRKVSGFQALYADTYMTRDEFEEMFDHKLYHKLRTELPYCKDAFPEVYDKVNKKARY